MTIGQMLPLTMRQRKYNSATGRMLMTNISADSAGNAPLA
jgi:hypothetical protein